MEEEQMDLPPGFRFHPTDEELITHYLSEKATNPETFTSRAIGDVDLNKCEPWDLPWKAKMAEEWYFFCVRDRKYPTGMRTNRATCAGYWKATGKDKEIYRGKSLVGMKKTLVFYRGRAPKGEKTNWVIHEYRLEGKCSLPKTVKDEWVICRVFDKSSTGKKSTDELCPSPLLPPLMEVSPYNNESSAHVTCFSSSMEAQIGHEDLFSEYFNYTPSEVSPLPLVLGKMPLETSFYGNQAAPSFGCVEYAPASLVQLLQSHGYGGMKQSCKTEREREMLSVSQDTGLTSDINPEISSVVSNSEMGRHSFDANEQPSASAGHLPHVDALWNY